MTASKKQDAQGDNTQLKDEQLDEASGGTGFFKSVSGLSSEQESTTGRTIIGGFKTLSGMDSETEVVEFKEGGVNSSLHQLPTKPE